MHLYSVDGIVKKYESVEQIIEEYSEHRYELYDKRKEYLIKKIKYEMDILANKVKFINSVIVSYDSFFFVNVLDCHSVTFWTPKSSPSCLLTALFCKSVIFENLAPA